MTEQTNRHCYLPSYRYEYKCKPQSFSNFFFFWEKSPIDIDWQLKIEGNNPWCVHHLVAFRRNNEACKSHWNTISRNNPSRFDEE